MKKRKEISAGASGSVVTATTQRRKKKRPPVTHDGSRQQLKKERLHPHANAFSQITPCCNRHCYSKIDSDRIGRYRGYVAKLESSVDKRARIHELHQDMVVDSGVCCVSYLANCFSVSKTFLYYDGVTSKKMKECPKTLSVLIWFHELQKIADVMPDAQKESSVKAPSAVYQIPHAKKKDVYEEYLQSCKDHGDVYTIVSPSMFGKTWEAYYPGVKLRKYLKFAKCSYCTTNRATRFDSNATQKERTCAHTKQTVHWEWVKKERAAELARQNAAVEKPEEVLVITQDATDFPFVKGYPSLPDASKADGEKRIKPHIMVSMSHGDAVHIYCALPHIAADWTSKSQRHILEGLFPFVYHCMEL